MAIKTLAAIAAATLLAIGPAVADQQQAAPLWRTFQKWEIRVDSNLGNGCFMQAYYDATGTALRIGVNAAHKDGYFEIMNGAWNSLAPGADLTVMLAFDNLPSMPWTGRVVTLTTGMRAIYFGTTNAKFWEAIAAASTITISYNGQQVLHGQMLGSAQAIQGLAECQQAFTAAQPPIDPFRATGPTRRIDPFKAL